MHFDASCDVCGRTAPSTAMRCPQCAGLLSFTYDTERLEWDERFAGVLRFWRLLPIAEPRRAITLGEGGTPLLRASAPRPDVYYKVETGNPTGSHKDRQICVAMSHAISLGKRVSALVSSGSTGLSNAAYAARAGIRSIVCMTAGVPADRIYPVFALGAEVVEVTGVAVDELIDRVARLTSELGVYHSTTARYCNPYQAEGAKTIAYEIVEELGRPPDWVVVPCGGGGTLAAIGRGFGELRAAGSTDRVPRLAGAVPAQFNALQRARDKGLRTQRELEALPDESQPGGSIQAKLAHVHPPDGADALAAVEATDGLFVSVSDDDALAAQAWLGSEEGIYVEPSSGTGVAALRRILAEGDVGSSDTVVVVLCGSGFRETQLTMDRRPMVQAAVDADGLGQLLAGT